MHSAVMKLSAGDLQTYAQSMIDLLSDPGVVCFTTAQDAVTEIQSVCMTILIKSNYVVLAANLSSIRICYASRLDEEVYTALNNQLFIMWVSSPELTRNASSVCRNYNVYSILQ